MAQNLLSVDEAAARLGISSDELMQLVDQRQVFGIKDGANWRFKPEEIDRYKSDRESGGSQSDEAFYLPVDEPESQEDDAGLVTEELVGSAGPSGSTIGSGGFDDDEGDSDLSLGDSDVKLAGDSDVKLIPDNDSGSGGSGLRLIPSGSSGVGSDAGLDSGSSGSGLGSGSDLELVDMDKPGSALKLRRDDDSSPSDSASGADTVEGKLPDPGSDLTISESGLSLGDDDVEIGSSSRGLGSSSMGASSLKLAGDFDDDDIVLGGSSSGVGSGIGDSGINLEAANDSGLSLEEPLELGGDDGLMEDSDEMDMSSDDDFLLTPMLELDDQDSDSSGSQVIALDTEDDFDDQAATILGRGDPDSMGMGIDQMAGPHSMSPGQSSMSYAPAAPQAQHSAFTVTFLALCFLSLGLTGMMTFELIRNIWSWTGTSEASAAIMDSILDALP